jgi:drug/metabolite transporter (DMT)-like permease
MTILGSTAALFLKHASGFRRVRDLAANANFYLGGLLYLIAALLNIYVLRFLEYSIVLPFTSLTYFWTMFLSHWALGERLNARKISGAVYIILGAIMLCIPIR